VSTVTNPSQEHRHQPLRPALPLPLYPPVHPLCRSPIKLRRSRDGRWAFSRWRRVFFRGRLQPHAFFFTLFFMLHVAELHENWRWTPSQPRASLYVSGHLRRHTR
jgi:hypothetical protein